MTASHRDQKDNTASPFRFNESSSSMRSFIGAQRESLTSLLGVLWLSGPSVCAQLLLRFTKLSSDGGAFFNAAMERVSSMFLLIYITLTHKMMWPHGFSLESTEIKRT